MFNPDKEICVKTSQIATFSGHLFINIDSMKKWFMAISFPNCVYSVK